MDTRKTCARFLGMALLTASFAVLSPPAQVEAQAAQTADAPEVSEERLTQYATLHQAISEARDEFQAEKARVHDAEARERLREEMDERLTALYEEHGMSKEDYDGITFLVSIDNDVRSRLETILASLNGTES
ncbi:MAG: DUF4168 domain-containing protein [Gemmatimonadota bacterium]